MQHADQWRFSETFKLKRRGRQVRCQIRRPYRIDLRDMVRPIRYRAGVPVAILDLRVKRYRLGLTDTLV